jgi:hypothetical protein
MAFRKGSIYSPSLRIKIRVILAERFSKIVLSGLSWYLGVAPTFLKRGINAFNSGFVIHGTYYTTNNAGLFSIVSTVYTDLAQSQIPIRRIDTRFGAILYKKFFFQNIWPQLFKEPQSAIKLIQNEKLFLCPPAIGWWCSAYRDLPLKDIHESISNHFRPSEDVNHLKLKLQNKYAFSPDQIIAVHFRGTDKAKEISGIPVTRYFDEIDRATKKFPRLRILLQVDEDSVRESFLSRYPEKSFYFSELVTSLDKVGPHYQIKTDPISEAKIYFAILLIISQSKLGITHTGNGALWELIFRGNHENFIQLGIEQI